MKLISEVLGLDKVFFLEAVDGEAGVPLSMKTTPEIVRIDKQLLENMYRTNPVIFNSINKIVQIIMSGNYKIVANDPKVEDFFIKFIDNIGYRGGEKFWDELLENFFKSQAIYGDSWCELIYNRQGNRIVDLDSIDSKKMDYAKNGMQEIALDKQGNPIGYVQTVPHSVAAEVQKRIEPPKNFGISLMGNQLFIPPERIAHFKLYSVGDGFYGIGLIEPCHTSAISKLEMEKALVNAIWRAGFPTPVASVGDKDHEPNPTQVKKIFEKIKNMNYKYGFAFPYYDDIKFLEAKHPEKLREHLNYWIEQEVTGMGIAKAFATGAGETTNRACYSEDTKVLTREGWKNYWEIKKDEEIAEYDLKTNRIEFKPHQGLFEYDYDGNMFNFLGKSEDILVTPDHRMLFAERRSDKWQVDKAENLTYADFKFKKNGKWVLKEVLADEFIIPHLEFEEGQGKHNELYESNIEISSSIFLEFLGYYLSEGGFSSKGNSYTITFAQKNEKNAEKMRICFGKIPLHFSEYYDEKDGLWRWQVSDKRLWTFMKQFGVYSNEKRMTFGLGLHEPQAKILFEAMMLGDGYWDRKLEKGYYATVSKKLAEDFVFLATTLGYSANIHMNLDNRGNRQPLYRINLIKDRNELHHRQSNIKVIDYDGKVFCFKTESGFFLTMRNGKVAIQGNTLARQEYILKLTLKDIVKRTTRGIETKMFRRISMMEGFKETPKIEWGELALEELDAKVGRIIGLKKQGLITADLDLENYLRKMENLPLKE